MIDFEQDATDVAMPTQTQLKNISHLAQKQRHLERCIKDTEATLENLKKDLKKVSEVDLPLAMQEVHMQEFKLDDGTKITIKKDLYPSITEVNKPAAFGWLIENGFGHVIKSDFSISFGRGEEEAAKTFMELLGENGYTYKVKEAVHPGTLKALIKEQVEAGVDVPLDTFSAFEVQKAKVEV